MKWVRSYGLVAAVALLAVGTLGSAGLAWQDQPPGNTAPGELNEDDVKRLPPLYTVVVRPKQRQEIYAIQDKYQEELSQLQSQIDAIVAKRDQEIEQILDAEQKQIIDLIRKLRAKERLTEGGESEESSGLPTNS